MNTFIDQYKRTYSVKKWTFEHFFCIFVYFVIFALPFYFCFASKNFWFDPSYSLMEVDYIFTGYYAIELNGNVYSNLQFPKDVTVDNSLTVQSPNQTSIVLTFQNGFNNPTLANILLFYDVQVPSLNKVASSSFAVSLSTNSLYISSITSKLSLSASTPFNALTSLSTYTVNKPCYLNENFENPSSFEELMNVQLQNEYKLQSQTYFEYGSAASTITLNLIKNKQVVLPYFPSILQTLKFKFSTYFGMLILSYLIFYNLMLQLAKDQALQCNQKDEIPAKIMKNN